MRIVRIFRDPINRDQRFKEPKIQLLDRDHSRLVIDSTIERARQIPRRVALRKVINSKQKEGPIFAHTYDLRLPSISQIQAKHWRSIGGPETNNWEKCLKDHLSQHIEGSQILETFS